MGPCRNPAAKAMKTSIKVSHYGCPIWSGMWSGGQSSRLQIQKSGFDSWHYQIFWEVMSLEQGPLSLVGTTEELLERKSNGSSLESWEYGLGILHADHVAPSIRKSWH
jgi:hypothetical protein